LLLVAFLLVYAPNCHHSLRLASVVQGDVVKCVADALWSVHVLHEMLYLLRINNVK